MSLKRAAEDYFSNLNPIATRLCSDLSETKSSYEDLWPSLSNEEQNQILNECIIKPEVSLKYDTSARKMDKTEFAVKLIIDDHCSYRDEHSGPFTFRTQSQRDLTIFAKDLEKIATNKVVKYGKEKKEALIYKCEEVVEDVAMFEEDDDAASLLPKTGLDFLDNW